MSKAGQSILRGAHQALAYAKGARDGFVAHVPDRVDVAAIRSRLGLSQAEFAARFGFKLDALQNWEQGRRYPDAAARAFLRVIHREPDAVLRALASDQSPPRASEVTDVPVSDQVGAKIILFEKQKAKREAARTQKTELRPLLTASDYETRPSQRHAPHQFLHLPCLRARM